MEDLLFLSTLIDVAGLYFCRVARCWLDNGPYRDTRIDGAISPVCSEHSPQTSPCSCSPCHAVLCCWLPFTRLHRFDPWVVKVCKKQGHARRRRNGRGVALPAHFPTTPLRKRAAESAEGTCSISGLRLSRMMTIGHADLVKRCRQIRPERKACPRDKKPEDRRITVDHAPRPFAITTNAACLPESLIHGRMAGLLLLLACCVCGEHNNVSAQKGRQPSFSSSLTSLETSLAPAMHSSQVALSDAILVVRVTWKSSYGYT